MHLTIFTTIMYKLLEIQSLGASTHAVLPDGSVSLVRKEKGTLSSNILGFQSADTNLDGGALQACNTPTSSVTGAGYDRTGSCAWDPSDAGYHEVCVQVTQTFLDNSKNNDGNDLSSVVSAGQNWCICAWAFASAVVRDSSNAEGLILECDKTNSKLREVYETNSQLQGPTGNSYDSAAALAYVNTTCSR